MHRLVFVMSIFAILMSGSAISQGKLKSTHGNWELRCDTPPGAKKEQCVVMQFVTLADRKNVALTVFALKTADQKTSILRILAPLGILLAPDNEDLGLQIDGANIGNYGMVRCLPNGCVSEIVMTSSILSKMKAGNIATFAIHQTPEDEIAIPVSLRGFTAGYNALP